MANAEQQAAVDLAKKLRLERQFNIKLRKLFRSMANEIAADYAADGDIDFLVADDFQPEFKSLLLEQYRRTQKQFKTTQRDKMKKRQSKALDDDVNKQLRQWNLSESEKVAAIITETNRKHIEEAIRQAIANLMLLESSPSGIGVGAVLSAPTSEAVAKEARRLLIADGVNRAGLIAVTETQKPAELAKLVEIDVLSQDQDFVEATGGGEMFKTWVNMGDDRVRPSHVEAGGQTVPANQPFTVGGYQMMIPADDSLGAPSAETLRCRCSAIYEVK